MLTAALAVARREVGWHVSPVRLADSITMDGPDSRILWLPTLKLVALTSITEDGTLLASSAYKPSVGDGPGLPRRAAVRKVSRGYWSCEYSAVTVVMDHGYTEAEAADWRQAILTMVDTMSLVPARADGTSPFGQTRKEIDDVTYAWAPYAQMAEGVLFSVESILDDFRLPSVEYF